MLPTVHGVKCSPILHPSPLYLHRLQKKLCRLLRRLSSRPQAHWEVLSALCQLPEKEAQHRGDWMSATHRPVTCVRRHNRWLTCRLNTQELILKVRNMVSNHWCFVSVLMKHAVCSKIQQLSISKDCILKKKNMQHSWKIIYVSFLKSNYISFSNGTLSGIMLPVKCATWFDYGTWDFRVSKKYCFVTVPSCGGSQPLLYFVFQP